MDIRQLRYFVTIAEEGTITKAAQTLHMAQPPLSRQLKLLEEELGVMLFERNKKKKLTLTVQGDLFLRKAKGVIHNLEEAIIEVQEFGEEISGTLAIGATIYDSPILLSKLKEFRKHYPHVRFSIWEGNSTHLMNLLENHQIDIAIAAGQFSRDHFEKHQLDNNPCVFIAPKEFHLDMESIDIAKISAIPLILLGPEEGNTLYHQIVSEFKRLYLTPRILCECHDSSMLLHLVTMGFGATILPSSLVQMVQIQLQENFNIIPIKDNPWVTKPNLIWRSNGYLSASTREFLRFFKKE